MKLVRNRPNQPSKTTFPGLSQTNLRRPPPFCLDSLPNGVQNTLKKEPSKTRGFGRGRKEPPKTLRILNAGTTRSGAQRCGHHDIIEFCDVFSAPRAQSSVFYGVLWRWHVKSQQFYDVLRESCAPGAVFRVINKACHQKGVSSKRRVVTKACRQKGESSKRRVVRKACRQKGVSTPTART